MNVYPITNARKPVEGLSPSPIQAHLIAQPTHLICGACGFNGIVQQYVMTDEPVDAFQPLCNCPLPTILFA